MSSIHLRHLTMTRPGPVRALQGVDLDIDAGTFAAVLGPSGCGKTTLLRIVAGLDRADGGSVRVGERTLAEGGLHVAPEKRGIGLVPQEGALFPHLDVAANVGFGLSGTPRDARAARVDDLLELVGLPGYGHRRPHELSGGQQQRVALARALAPGPDVVLLDEPFSALDTAQRGSIRDQVADVLRLTGTTVVLVTHDQDEAFSFADRVAVMRDGRIVQAGAPADIYQRPADLWAARFLGSAVVVPGCRPAPDADHVTTQLGRLRLDPDVDHHVGPEVAVLVRPEQIGRGSGPDAAPARVERVRFRGTYADVALRVGPSSVVARWTSIDLPPVDAEVAIEVTGAVIAFPPEDATAPTG